MTSLLTRTGTVLALVLALLLAGSSPAAAQQIADTTFTPPIPTPDYAAGAGPVVLIDEGHHNFHTRTGRFTAFARLAARNGYAVGSHSTRFTLESLAPARVLVISNAIEARNESAWRLPVWSAFDSAEVRVVERWVRDGGSLLLIADHMPFGGAAELLAAAFGVYLSNGFAEDSSGESEFVVRRSSGRLAPHAITDGRNAAERVDSVKIFTGQAFRAPASAEPLLMMGERSVVRLPEEAWKFSAATPRVRADGLLLGAALRHGRGRVVVYGEAAMLTAQLAGPSRERVGMNAPEAAHHARLVLNTLRWLAAPVSGAPR
ncbi:MAG: hypothetical protein HOP12_03335 [Candidatus Eisenbacteria bacterium]|uniref:DUF4350 domain-containing protein n=1 Tax=Eiseniibacteriota bacterium TaxID=2212470 RepID=A0A849SHZ7_UNCEI|nr:hypothetical protein [Candidatus Eisenbacteria bacterium]